MQTDGQINGQFSISNELLGEGLTGIVYKGSYSVMKKKNNNWPHRS